MRSTFRCQKERSPAAREKVVKGDRPLDTKRALAKPSKRIALRP
ncbi:hypothetical protein QUB60_19085 [Microcoleus sp. A2-C5]